MAARARRAVEPAPAEVVQPAPPRRTRFEGTATEDYAVVFRGVFVSFKPGSPVRVDSGFHAFLVENKAPIAWEN